MVLYGGTYTSAGLFLGVLLLLEVMQRVLSLSNHVALIAIGTAAIIAIDILYFAFITSGCVFFIITYSFFASFICHPYYMEWYCRVVLKSMSGLSFALGPRD